MENELDMAPVFDGDYTWVHRVCVDEMDDSLVVVGEFTETPPGSAICFICGG